MEAAAAGGEFTGGGAMAIGGGCNGADTSSRRSEPAASLRSVTLIGVVDISGAGNDCDGMKYDAGFIELEGGGGGATLSEPAASLR